MSDDKENTNAAEFPAVNPPPKQKRGFAVMSKELQREIASKGGKASHAKGTGHEWDTKSAVEAGKRGAVASLASKMKAKANAKQ